MEDRMEINHDNSGSLMITFGLWIIAGISYLASHMIQFASIPDIFEIIFTWIFRLASLSSVILVIAVNWKKGIDQIKEWIGKRKKK